MEIIQSEGLDAAKIVNPNIVIKKKDGKEHEVQEGWVGYVLPFDLVQQRLLSKELEPLKAKERELAETISAELRPELCRYLVQRLSP